MFGTMTGLADQLGEHGIFRKILESEQNRREIRVKLFRQTESPEERMVDIQGA